MLFSAIDPDEGNNGAVTYSIVGSVKQKSRSLFKIQSFTGRINTIKALDHEDMKEHTLIIKAIDQGTPTTRESRFSVVIAVDDVNDHKPVFLRSEFKAEVHVDASQGTFILKVFAVDGDDGTNALLKFSMKGGNTNDAFYIDQNSGVIQVASKLSSSIEKYYLQVQVSDSGTLAETAETEVQVRQHQYFSVVVVLLIQNKLLMFNVSPGLTEDTAASCLFTVFVFNSGCPGLNLAGDIVLCSWARHITLTVPLSTQVHNGYWQI